MITVADIIAQFGAHYKNGGQGLKDLRVKFFQTSETDALFQQRITVDTQLEGGNVTVGNVLQAFQKAFTAYGDPTITGRIIPLHKLKIDVAQHPDELSDTWAGFLAGVNEIDRSKWPFVRWFLEELVLPQSIEDWENNAVFGGVKGVIVAGTPLPAAEAVNGIKKVQNDAITDGDLVPLALGAVPADPVALVDYIEAFIDAIPPIYRKYLQGLAMGITHAENFMRGMDMKYNTNYAQTGNAKTRYTNIPVLGLPSHEGSDIMWTTVKGNAVMGTKNPKNRQMFEIEKVDRQVKAYTDFYKGLGFWRYDWLFRNDVELPA